MQNSQIRKIAYTAILIACDILLTRVLAINTAVMKIGLGFLAVALCSTLYGPLWGAMAAAIGDILGSVIFPTGAYYFPFTVTAALTGLIFGLFLYRKFSVKKAVIAAAVNVTAVSYIMNTALIARLSGASYTALLATRSIQLAVMLIIQPLVLALVLPRIIRKIS